MKELRMLTKWMEEGTTDASRVDEGTADACQVDEGGYCGMLAEWMKELRMLVKWMEEGTVECYQSG
jgi:hypothetical protein